MIRAIEKPRFFGKLVLKILLWLGIAIVGFYVLGFLIFGFRSTDSSKGIHNFKWSGLAALFTKEEFKLQENEIIATAFDGIDGPYIVGDQMYRIDSDNKLSQKTLDKTDSIPVHVKNTDEDSFFINLQTDTNIPSHQHKMPEKLIAISDIEGNFNAFSSFLQSNNVIDENHDWCFGNGHLVLIGDFLDRGANVTQVLWLIYKMDYQAKLDGGNLHYILGNHEIMNIRGDVRYAQKKYIATAQAISGIQDWDKASIFMFSDNTELGRWIQKKNIFEKIGDYLFVHAGLSYDLVQQELSIENINNFSRKIMDDTATDTLLTRILFGRTGPIWYRGNVIDYKYYDKITEEQLDEVLAYYDAQHIVVGHTVVDSTITTDFDGKIIRIDLRHSKTKNSGKTKGLLIEDGKEFIIDDLGNREKL